MIRQILHQLDTMKHSSQSSWRQLCDLVPYASVMRWRQRQRQGLPLWQCPGPKKSVPLDWTEFYPLLRQLTMVRCARKALVNSAKSLRLPSRVVSWVRWCRIIGGINFMP